MDQLTTTKKPLLVNDVAAQPNFRPGDESLEDGELEGTEAATSNGLQPDVEPQVYSVDQIFDEWPLICMKGDTVCTAS